jgi:hypothetical protein
MAFNFDRAIFFSCSWLCRRWAFGTRLTIISARLV